MSSDLLFKIGLKDLQEIMSKYKNRVNDYKNPDYFDKVLPSEIFSKIKTKYK